jgi:hypothetical protein
MSLSDRFLNHLIRHYEDPESRITLLKWLWRTSLAMLVLGYIILFYLLFKK